jgi:hypothetical protein
VTLEQTGVTCANGPLQKHDPLPFEHNGNHTLWMTPKWGWNLESVLAEKASLLDVYIPETFPKLTSSNGEKAGWVKPWVLVDRAHRGKAYLMDMFEHFKIDWTEGL